MVWNNYDVAKKIYAMLLLFRFYKTSSFIENDKKFVFISFEQSPNDFEID